MMRLVDNSVLLRWRRLPALDVLKALADYVKVDSTFVPVKSQQSTRWHARFGNREFELLLTGPKFWDTRQRKGGGGAVDLAMHLADVDFGRAVQLLQERGV